MTFRQMFTSTIGKKFVMALTGISLILFLIVHVGLNATIWADDHGKMFNTGANFMGSMLVISTQKATAEPAAEPRPGPTSTPIFLL